MMWSVFLVTLHNVLQIRRATLCQARNFRQAYLHCIHHQELVSLLEIELNFSAALSAAMGSKAAAVESLFHFGNLNN